MKRKNRLVPISSIIAILLLAALACSVTSSSTPQTSGDEGLQQTMAALSVAETMVAIQQTQSAAGAQAQPVAPTVEQPAAPPAEEAAPVDYDALIKGAKILLYEDTWQIGTWVYDTIKGMGLTATYDGDAVGHFMEHLGSTQWDLIIMASEHHGKVQGEVWDAIMTALNGSNKPALIAEVWYLNYISEGKIKTFTNECGVQWQKDIPSAVPVYWLEPDSPFHNNPMTVPSLTGPGGYWEDAGDEISLMPGSDAIMLAGTHASDKSSHGVIANCFDGRVILQTFCDHDFSRGTIQVLWKNYITNTLIAHFQATQ